MGYVVAAGLLLLCFALFVLEVWLENRRRRCLAPSLPRCAQSMRSDTPLPPSTERPDDALP